MSRGALEVLKSVNQELLGCRWTDEDLHRLIATRFGAVSGFESLSRDLTDILQKDLGDSPPALPPVEIRR